MLAKRTRKIELEVWLNSLTNPFLLDCPKHNDCLVEKSELISCHNPASYDGYEEYEVKYMVCAECGEIAHE